MRAHAYLYVWMLRASVRYLMDFYVRRWYHTTPTQVENVSVLQEALLLKNYHLFPEQRSPLFGCHKWVLPILETSKSGFIQYKWTLCLLWHLPLKIILVKFIHVLWNHLCFPRQHGFQRCSAAWIHCLFAGSITAAAFIECFLCAAICLKGYEWGS